MTSAGARAWRSVLVVVNIVQSLDYTRRCIGRGGGGRSSLATKRHGECDGG